MKPCDIQGDAWLITDFDDSEELEFFEARKVTQVRKTYLCDQVFICASGCEFLCDRNEDFDRLFATEREAKIAALVRNLARLDEQHLRLIKQHGTFTHQLKELRNEADRLQR